MPKRPSFQFYPADWLKDTGLQACSFAAQGLWMKMLCIMHESDVYGMLVVNEKPLDEQQLQRLVGGTPRMLEKLLAELEENGVFSRTDEGVIYCRRMVRDEHIRTVRSEAGRKGAEATNARNLPPAKSQQTVRQTVQQNGGKRHAREGAPARPPAQSSSSSLTTQSSSQSSDSPDVAAVLSGGVTLPSMPAARPHPPEVAERIRREKAKLAEMATGPPGNDD